MSEIDKRTIGCEVARDLMPLEIDGVCSEESKRLVREHMDVCQPCKDVYAGMTKAFQYQTKNEEAATFASTMKSMRRTLTRKRLKYILLGLLIALCLGFCISWGVLELYSDTSKRELPIDEYKVSLLQTEKGFVAARWTFENNVPEGQWHTTSVAEEDGKRVCYLSYHTSVIRHGRGDGRNVIDMSTQYVVRDGVIHDTLSTYNGQPMYNITQPLRREVGEAIDEIRAGTPQDYKVVYRKGDELERLDEAQEHNLFEGDINGFGWNSEIYTIPFEALPLLNSSSPVPASTPLPSPLT